MEFEFTEVDDVNGDTTLEVWGSGSRLHFRVFDDHGNSLLVYIKNGTELAQMILASSWGYQKEDR